MKQLGRRLLSYCALLFLAAGLFGCDHATKAAATSSLGGGKSVSIIGDIVELRWTPNPDVAFSMARNLGLTTWSSPVVLATLAALWFLGMQQNLISYLILSELLAHALEPAVVWLHEKRGWRRGSATGLLLVAVFLLLVVLGIGLAAVLAREADQIVDQLPTYIDKMNGFTRDHFDISVFSASQRAGSR